MFFKKELRMFKKSIVARNIYNINFFHYKSKKDFFEEIVGNKEFIEELKKNLENRFNREQQKLFEQELNKPKNKDLKIAISA